MSQVTSFFNPCPTTTSATDWALEDNYNTKVAVISESFGCAQSVSKLLKTVGLKPFDAEPDDYGFEMLVACNSFPMPPAEPKVCKPNSEPIQLARIKYKKKAVVPQAPTGRTTPAQARPKKRVAPLSGECARVAGARAVGARAVDAESLRKCGCGDVVVLAH